MGGFPHPPSGRHLPILSIGLDSITGPTSSKQIRSHREGKESDFKVAEKCQLQSDTLNPENQISQLIKGFAKGLCPTSLGQIPLTAQLPFVALILCWWASAPSSLACHNHTHPSTSCDHLPPLFKVCEEAKSTEMALTGGETESYPTD